MSTEKLESEAIAKKVRELMEYRGISERKHTGELGRILKLGFSAAHRKINGESPWTVSQIIEVAAHYNERPGALLDSIFLNNPLSPSNNIAQEAILTILGREFTCMAQISELLPKNQSASFVAFENKGQWRIVEMMDAPPELELYKVKKIEINPARIHNLSIAVIDDDIGTANNIRDYLNELGFKATAFYDIHSTATALRNNVFDGYILDWFVGKETSEGLLKLIRASNNQNAPVILLTGQMLTGMVNDTEVAGLMRRFDVLCQEKPVRLPIIAEELFKMFGLK